MIGEIAENGADIHIVFRVYCRFQGLNCRQVGPQHEWIQTCPMQHQHPEDITMSRKDNYRHPESIQKLGIKGLMEPFGDPFCVYRPIGHDQWRQAEFQQADAEAYWGREPRLIPFLVSKKRQRSPALVDIPSGKPT